MFRTARAVATSLLAVTALAAPARAGVLDVPPEGSCAPRPLQWTPDPKTQPGDVVPPAFKPGDVVEMSSFTRLSGWLPDEVWERRQTFFFEGMQLEIGPCYRRFPMPSYFLDATRENAGKAKLDGDGNLRDYAGAGLPFALESLDDSATDFAGKLAWDYRYRYQAAGFRGDFRITQITEGGRDFEQYSGTFFFLPLHGVPGAQSDDKNRFAAGGAFQKPETARGLAWRQYQLAEAESDWKTSDEVFVYLPSERKVRRAPPQNAEGVYVPSFTRARSVGNVGFTMPDGQTTNVGNPGLAASEPLRKGFVGLLIRPNAYDWTLVGARDVLAPANVRASGYPPDASRNFGPSGLSLGSDRWDLRRAVVITGKRKLPDARAASVTLWIDALTLQPLYWISRRANGSVWEVGIFAHRFSADDRKSVQWKGNGDDFGVMIPVAQSFMVSGEGGGWRREAYVLASEPPPDADRQNFLSVQQLQRDGR